MTIEHAKVFGSLPNVELSGIFSRTSERAEKVAREFKILKVCGSVKSLFQATKSDLVVISVNELSTAQVCGEAFKFPWVLLIEKPVGLSPLQARQLCNVARQKKRKAFVALNRRHMASTRAVLQDLKNDRQLRIVNVLDQEYPKLNLRLGEDPRVIRMWMFANSIHIVDYFSIFCRGELLEVKNEVPFSPKKPWHVLSTLKFSSGDTGIYQAFWNSPGPWSVGVQTKTKRWELRPLEKGYFQTLESRALRPFSDDILDSKFKPGFFRQAQNALEAVRGRSHSLPSLNEGVITMETISRIYNIKS